MAIEGQTVMKATPTLQSRLCSKLCAEMDPSAKSDCGSTSTRQSTRTSTRPSNRDLQKTKLCVYFSQGKCGQGTSCPFAHNASEIRTVPNLVKTQLCTAFMRGVCKNKNCNYAHGEEELIKLPNFKKKLCVWFKQGKCRNGAACGFVHDLAEYEGEGEPPMAVFPTVPKILLPAKSGKSARFDDDASTVVPSSRSPRSAAQTLESDVSTMAAATMPDENLFRMMAGRGSAPLQQQVKSMLLAIGDLQRKLTMVKLRQQAAGDPIEGQALQVQVDEMQNAITQLSSKCRGMEAHLGAKQPAPPAKPEPNSVRGFEVRHSPGVRQKRVEVKEGSDMLPPREKAQKISKKDYRPNKAATKRSYATETRVALGMIVVAMMVMVEMTLMNH